MTTTAARLASLDQFRGYTVVGMLLVNFMDHFRFIHPTVLAHHHAYCSYADAIMPQFLFAAGFALRWTWRRRAAEHGAAAAWQRVFWRCLGLFLLGAVVYGLDRKFDSWQALHAALANEGVVRLTLSCFEREPFQTLVHIAVTTLFLSPVVGAGAWVRIAYAAAALGLHAGISHAGYFDFAWRRPVIDGGPLGFLTWATPAVAGTLAADMVRAAGANAAGKLAGWGIVLALLGYGLSCPTMRFREPPPTGFDAYFAEPPFVPPNVRQPSPKFPERAESQTLQRPNYWMMSQRAGTPSYLVFSAGFSLLTFAGFLWACDRWGWALPIFRTFGVNALVAYLLHGIVAEPIQRLIPNDAPMTPAWLSFAVFLWINWLFVRQLEKQGVFIRM